MNHNPKNRNSVPSAATALCIISLVMMMPQPALASAGIDPWVSEQLQNQNQVEFIVRFKARANLDSVRGVQNALQRRTLMVDRLRQTASQSQADLRQLLDRRRVEYRSFWITNAIWIRGDQALVGELSQRSDVAHIHANPQVRMEMPTAATTAPESPQAVEWNITLIGAPDVWNAGVTGVDAVIGGQDTGYDWDHPALINAYRGWNGATADHNFNWHDSIHVDNPSCSADSSEPCDDHNHGTHTMGTMVGDDGGSNQVGVAPGAKWIGCRNMNQGNGTPASYVECFEWFIAPTDLNGENPDPSKAPHVINNSWSCPVSEGCNDPNIMIETVSNVVDAGIMVVVSAGNAGPGCSSVSTPTAIYELSFSVGSTTNTDAISSFSSRGPVTVDGSNRMKPDISAPGSGVRSSIRGGGYSTFDGTSMAAPHVAGLVALMISADPGLAGEIETLRSVIQGNALKLTSTQTCGGVPGSSIPNNTFGHGRIRAYRSVFEEFYEQGFESPKP